MSLKMCKNNMSNDSRFEDSRKSVHSADSSLYMSLSGKNNFDLISSNENEKNLKKSLLNHLVNNTGNEHTNVKTPIIYNNIQSNNIEPLQNKIENKLKKLIETSKIKQQHQINDKNFKPDIQEKFSSCGRISDLVENKNTKSELKFSNVFIRPINETNLGNKNQSSTNEKFVGKKRKIIEIQSNEAKNSPDQFERDNNFASYSLTEDKDSIKEKNKTRTSIALTKPSNLVIKNNHLNSHKTNCNIYNPFTDTLILSDSSTNFSKERSNNVQASYYTSLQKMPGSIKNSKRLANLSRNLLQDKS
jgi:hypothetical protein